MSKVTSKLQLTIPKALAARYGIRPGDEVRWEELPRGAVMIRVPTGGAPRGGGGIVGEGTTALRGVRTMSRTPALLRTPEERLAHFDRETRWIEALIAGRSDPEEKEEKERIERVKRERGWTREDLYEDPR